MIVGPWFLHLCRILDLLIPLGILCDQQKRQAEDKVPELYRGATGGCIGLTTIVLLFHIAAFSLIETDNTDLHSKLHKCDMCGLNVYKTMRTMLALFYLCTGALYVNTPTQGRTYIYGIILIFFGTCMMIPNIRDDDKPLLELLLSYTKIEVDPSNKLLPQIKESFKYEPPVETPYYGDERHDTGVGGGEFWSDTKMRLRKYDY